MTLHSPAMTASPWRRVPGAAERSPLVTKIVGLYVFLLFCRILEVLPVFGLGALRLMLVITAIALVIVFTTGNLVRALKTPLGILLVAWTAWMVICMPFSTWHAETLSQFVNTWLKSLAVFFIIAGLGGTLSSFRTVMTAMGWAAAAAALVVLPGIATAGTGNGANDRLVGIGTLSNPNEIAFHLWLGMSFLLLLASRGGMLKRVFLLAVCCFELLLIVKTVSREGLLLGLVVFVLALFRVSTANKMKLLMAALGVCLVAVATLSPQAVDRYMTLFTSDVSGAAVRSAEASTKMRHQKLMESIELTLRHPIFGVGMGVFMPASVEIAKEKGNTVDWQVSHNSYTQVSSELGFPGILLLLAIYVVAWRQLSRIDKASKRLGREDIRQVAFALRVALVVLCVHFCFDSMAYLFYMPLVMGLIAAFVLAYQPTLSGVTEPELEPEDVAITRLTLSAVEKRNPFRFGRRR
ncbi:MAG TPA: O-antigen ligase family protein [Bryobacteraceae bacterium]|nr:O-antigen ligase family protein [Bryobacteraceae bacterium]